MFVRKVGVCLKPASTKEFAHLMESRILPWLRQQDGFQDLVILAEPDGCRVATLTFWDHDLNQQACEGACAEGLKILEDLLDSVPYVKTFNVIGSTISKLAPGGLREANEFVNSETPDTASFRVA